MMLRSLSPGQLAQVADLTRASVRPTSMVSTFGPERIQEVVLGIFRRFATTSMDMDALVYFVLREFNVGPSTFEHMQKTVKAHILKNFAIQQGAPLRLTEVAMRRVTVCYTIEGHED